MISLIEIFYVEKNHFLGKTYDVTYIKLTFQSPKPESFVIYKRTYENSSWIPYQYYSASCMLTFGLQPKKYPDFDTEAICSEDFSGLTPLHGSEVAFGTLDWRPGAVTFEMRNDLQVRKIHCLMKSFDN